MDVQGAYRLPVGIECLYIPIELVRVFQAKIKMFSRDFDQMFLENTYF